MTVQLSSFTAEQQEGYIAYSQGKPPSQNPYPWGTARAECEGWIRGYAAARTDRKKAIRSQP